MPQRSYAISQGLRFRFGRLVTCWTRPAYAWMIETAGVRSKRGAVHYPNYEPAPFTLAAPIKNGKHRKRVGYV